MLLAIVILGLASVAILTAFATSISSSSEHRSLATFDTVLRSAASEAIAQLQEQTQSEFQTCPGTYSVNFSLPAGYSAYIASVQYWNGTSFGSTCVVDVPQLVTITVTSPTGAQYSISVVVNGPLTKPIPASGAAYKLVFLQTPATGSSTAGQVFQNQPQVAIEDQNGNIVTNDLSYLTLALSNGAVLSGCSGTEFGGVVSFTGCSTTQAGTYTITATDNYGALTATSSAFTVAPSQPTQLVFSTPSPGPGTAGSPIPNVGVQIEDAFGNVVPSASGSTTMGILSGSPQSTFSSGTTAVPLSSGVSTFPNLVVDKSGTYSLTATSSISGVSGVTSSPFTITPASASTFTLSNPGTQTAGTSFSDTITAYDAYGNVATGFTGSQAISFSGPANGPNGTAPTYPVTVNFTSGVGTATGIVLTDAQSTTLTATQAGVTGTSTSFTVNAGATTQTAITPSPSTATASNTTNVALNFQLEDQYGNHTTSAGTTTLTLTSPSATDFFAATSGASGTGILGNSGSVSFANGVGTATSYYGDETAEPDTITAKKGSTTWGTTSVSVIGGTATKAFIAPSPTSASANGATNVALVVQLEDQFGNATTSTGTTTLTLTSPSATDFFAATSGASGTGILGNSGSVSFANGVGTATSYYGDEKAETDTITAKNGASTWATTSVTITPASASTFTLSNPGTQTAGTSFSDTITAYDAYGNVATGFTGSQAISFSGPANGPNGTAPTYPVTVNFTSGVGTATGIVLTDAQSTTLTATQAGVTGTSTSFTVNAGATTQTAITPSPSTATASNTTNVALNFQLEDQYGNHTTSAGTTTLTLTSPSATDFFAATSGASGTGILGNSGSVSFANGVGTATSYYGDEKVETDTITAKKGTTTLGTTSVTIAPGVAAEVAITPSPSTATASNTTNVALNFQLEDQFGNATTSTGTTTLALTSPSATDFFAATSGASGTGILGNSGSVSFANGVGTATTYYGDEAAESDTITAKNGASTWGTTSVTITAGAATKVVFTTEPSATSTGGTAFATQPVVKVEDAFGNTVTTDSSAVNLAVTAGTGTTGASLSCTTNPVTAVNGVATFAGCSINKSGTNYTLTASDGTLASAASTAITVSVGPATQLAFTTSPGAATTATVFATQPVVTVEDAGGNTVTTNTSTVTVAINTGTGTLGTCPAVNAVGGIATFSGCKITLGTQGAFTLKATDGVLAQATSASFTVAGAANKLGFATSPGASTGGTAFGTQPVVWVEDSSGDLVTTNTSTVTMAINTGTGTLTCPAVAAVGGIATFSGCKITLGTQGAFTLKASGTVTSAISSSFTVAGTATKLVFTTQPVGPTHGTAFTTQPVVSVEDSSGDVVTTSTASITLAIGSNPGGGVLTCTTNPVTAAGGVATYGGCSISAAGTGYTLTATASGLATATSSAFNLS